MLYGGAYFRCRQCHGLRYSSQYLNALERIQKCRWGLRHRLGSAQSLEDPLPPKPKGMHWVTYRRLVERDEALAEQWQTGVAEWLERTAVIPQPLSTPR